MNRKSSPDRSPRAFRVREAAAADAAGIRRLLRRSWSDTYGAFIPFRDLLHGLNEHYSAARLREQIADTRSRCVVAESGGRIIGFLRLEACGAPPSSADG